LDEYGTEGEAAAADGEQAEQQAGGEELEQEGADEPAAEKDPHGEDVVVLRLGGGEADAGHPVVDDKRPAHDLRADVGGLGDDATEVVEVGEELAQEGAEVDLGLLVAGVGQLGDDESDEHGEHDEGDDDVGQRH
jgi:hypothetical protein